MSVLPYSSIVQCSRCRTATFTAAATTPARARLEARAAGWKVQGGWGPDEPATTLVGFDFCPACVSALEARTAGLIDRILLHYVPATDEYVLGDRHVAGDLYRRSRTDPDAKAAVDRLLGAELDRQLEQPTLPIEGNPS